MNTSKIKTIIAATALVATLGASPCFAGSVSGQVTHVELVNGSASWFPQLLVKINGTSTLFFGQQPSPSECSLPTASPDIIKVWHSMVLAALLSHKNVTIYYNNCPVDAGNTNNYIYSVVIFP